MGRLSGSRSQVSRTPWWRSWTYNHTTGRDLRLDLLRGFCVFVMVVDHIAGPSLLYRLTGGNDFFVSAAEGFVFISGLLLGLIYRKTIQRQGFGAALGKAFRRAASLYLLMLGLALAFNIGGSLIGLPWVDTHHLSSLTSFVWSVVALRRPFWLTDILVMYTLLVAAAPLALWLLQRKHTIALLAGSWLLWLIYQRYPDLLSRPLPALQSFHPAAWQIFFVHALALGYHRDRVARFFTPERRRWLFVLSGVLVALLLLMYHHPTVLPDRLVGSDNAAWLQMITLKDDVRLGRLVASAVVFPFAYLLVTYLWQPVRFCLGWLFLPLGQHSLTGYALHLPLVLLTLRFAPEIARVHLAPPSLNTLVQLCAVLLIWVLVQWRSLFATIGLSRVINATTKP